MYGDDAYERWPGGAPGFHLYAYESNGELQISNVIGGWFGPRRESITQRLPLHAHICSARILADVHLFLLLLLLLLCIVVVCWRRCLVNLASHTATIDFCLCACDRTASRPDVVNEIKRSRIERASAATK